MPYFDKLCREISNVCEWIRYTFFNVKCELRKDEVVCERNKKRIYQRFRDFNEIKGSHVMVANIHKIYRSRDKAIDVRNNLVALFLIDFIHQQPQRSSSGKPS